MFDWKNVLSGPNRLSDDPACADARKACLLKAVPLGGLADVRGGGGGMEEGRSIMDAIIATA